MRGYIYCADVFCRECGKKLRETIEPPPNPTYDSDEYPKGPYDFSKEVADSPNHCGMGPCCVNALVVDGIKVGCWLGNRLTEDGVEYVREAIADGDGLVCHLWAKWYRDSLRLARQERV